MKKKLHMHSPQDMYALVLCRVKVLLTLAIENPVPFSTTTYDYTSHL